MFKLYSGLFLSAALLSSSGQAQAHTNAHMIYGVDHAKELSAHANGTYYIRLGAFKNEANANRLYQSLRPHHQSTLKVQQMNGLYIVILGPLHSGQEVRAAVRKLSGEGAERVHRVAAKPVHRYKAPALVHAYKTAELIQPSGDQCCEDVTKPDDTRPFLLRYGHPAFHIGGLYSAQGSEQYINSRNLIGDRYTVSDHNDFSGLVGVGYLLNGNSSGRLHMDYGLDAFYLADTSVKGVIVQENMYSNLSYKYNVSHLPVYVAAKATINMNDEKYALTVDAGLGPNFMNTSHLYEASLDGGITEPDNAFGGKWSTTLSATAGLGLKVNQAFGQHSVECGYRFFYLGQGDFHRNTNQVLSTLNTGQDYAQAIVCSATM